MKPSNFGREISKGTGKGVEELFADGCGVCVKAMDSLEFWVEVGVFV